MDQTLFMQVDGVGQELAEIEVLTGEGAAAPPENLRIVGAVSTTGFQLAWDPPGQHRGLIQV
jgi:hypothetical protein